MRYRMTDPLWAYFGRTLVKPLVIAAIAGAMLFEIYYLLEPTEGNLAATRRKLAERVSAQVAADLPKKGGTPSLAVLNLAGDANGLLTQSLREQIGATGQYRMLEDSFFKRLLREFGKESEPVSRLAEAVATARGVGVDMVLFGEVADFTVDSNARQLKLELRMAERQSGQAVFARSYFQGGPARESWRSRMAEGAMWRKVFVWLMFTVLLPIVSIPLIRRLTAMDSNLMNVALLSGLTLADMLMAFSLTGFGISGFWTVLVLLLALLASSYYNYRIATVVEEMGH